MNACGGTHKQLIPGMEQTCSVGARGRGKHNKNSRMHSDGMHAQPTETTTERKDLDSSWREGACMSFLAAAAAAESR